jgi:hypothetical protein
MKLAIPMLILVVTLALITVGPFWTGRLGGTVGIASGGSLPGLKSAATTPEQAVTGFLVDVQKRDWNAAHARLADATSVDQSLWTKELAGSDGSLRSFSSLASWELHPLHATDQDAQVRVTLRWSTPVGPTDEVRDIRALHREGGWKIVWPQTRSGEVPAQVIPVNFLRWDLVTGGSQDEWGQRSVDAPKVRIISMNPVEYEGGSIVMGEVVNEDTIPAFVNVNAALVDANGNPIDEESSFDKILHVLLPKQVSPYRIDFPGISLKSVKNVHMDVKATLVPASADPVIGAMDQKIDKDAAGRTTLRGQLLSQSGQVVNIPHVIATFYDNNGRVIWVSDGYVDGALLPDTPEPFAVEIPGIFAGKVQSYHVAVNQYSLGNS